MPPACATRPVRADIDQHHPSGLAAGQRRLVDGRQGKRQRHGGVGGFHLLVDQLSVRPGGKRGRFGNAGNADLLFDNSRRAGKTRRLGSKRLTVKMRSGTSSIAASA